MASTVGEKRIITVITARGGSEGLPNKNVLPLLGKPVIAYTIEAALASTLAQQVFLSTDDEQIARIAASFAGVTVINRPKHLATASSRIDDVLRDAVRQAEVLKGVVFDVVVLLYGNVPVRGEGVIDRAIRHLLQTGADSVQSYTPVGKFHPLWMHKLEGPDGDRVVPYAISKVHRRQDLPPLYIVDGAVVVVKRQSLFAAEGSDDPHAFLGTDRRGIRQQPYQTVDIDNLLDVFVAEAAMRMKDSQIVTALGDR